MICGLRSQAAGVKSHPSDDMEKHHKIRSIPPQYEISPLWDWCEIRLLGGDVIYVLIGGHIVFP
jgi:hypothetical protein